LVPGSAHSTDFSLRYAPFEMTEAQFSDKPLEKSCRTVSTDIMQKRAARDTYPEGRCCQIVAIDNNIPGEGRETQWEECLGRPVRLVQLPSYFFENDFDNLGENLRNNRRKFE
jgi:hypothetical protein